MPAAAVLDGEGAPRNGALLTAEIGYATAALARGGGLSAGGAGILRRHSSAAASSCGTVSSPPAPATAPVAAGLDVELRHQSYRFSSTDWAVTLRPILDLRTGPWQLILNPAVEFPLGRDGPVFAPAMRGVRRVAETVWLGLEHYMDFGRIDRPAAPPGPGAPAFRHHRFPGRRDGWACISARAWADPCQRSLGRVNSSFGRF